MGKEDDEGKVEIMEMEMMEKGMIEVMQMEICQRRAVCVLDKICKVPSNVKYE